MIQIADPRLIPTSEGPMIVSKGGGTDLMSRLIRWRTKSWCEHSMLFVNQGEFVWESAASWYGPGPMDSYLTPGTCLRFYRLVDINPAAVIALNNYIATRLASPWYDKTYDWVGIVGEAIGFPKIHTPGLEYCSVDAIHALEAMGTAIGGDSENIIAAIPPEENPGYLDLVMNQYVSVFQCAYQYNYKK